MDADYTKEYNFSAFAGGFTDPITQKNYVIFIKKVNHLGKFRNLHDVFEISTVSCFSTAKKKENRSMTSRMNKVSCPPK